MKEATLRDFFIGAAPVDKIREEVEGAFEHQSAQYHRVHIQDLTGDEEFIVTPPMLVRLCDAVLTGELPGPALEPIAFAIIASDHLHWTEDDELVSRVLYDWASPEVNWELTPDNVRMFRGWLTGEIDPPPLPDPVADIPPDAQFLSRTEKVWIRLEEDPDRGKA